VAKSVCGTAHRQHAQRVPECSDGAERAPLTARASLLRGLLSYVASPPVSRHGRTVASTGAAFRGGASQKVARSRWSASSLRANSGVRGGISRPAFSVVTGNRDPQPVRQNAAGESDAPSRPHPTRPRRSAHQGDVSLRLLSPAAGTPGKKRAIRAVAHSIMVSALYMLARHEPYRELGGNYFDERRRHSPVDRLAARLERLGYRVHLEPVMATTE
jgi:hypothetical protein